MKYLVASDIHGSAYYCERLLEAYEQEKADKLILLGDILYHGPRNDLPKEYCPKKVIPLLNAHKEQILAVRGNCDAEVDQMVLDFPITSDYETFELKKGQAVVISHGHIYYEGNLPPVKSGDIFMYGHTHVLRAELVNGIIYLNPGSVSIPKEGNPPTYAVMEEDRFVIKTFENELVKEYHL